MTRPEWMAENPYRNMGEGNIMAVLSDDAYKAQAKKLLEWLEGECADHVAHAPRVFCIECREQLRKEIND